MTTKKLTKWLALYLPCLLYTSRNLVWGVGFCFDYVALLAEGVDRNIAPMRYAAEMAGRPPRGGRG